MNVGRLGQRSNLGRIARIQLFNQKPHQFAILLAQTMILLDQSLHHWKLHHMGIRLLHHFFMRAFLHRFVVEPEVRHATAMFNVSGLGTIHQSVTLAKFHLLVHFHDVIGGVGADAVGDIVHAFGNSPRLFT